MKTKLKSKFDLAFPHGAICMTCALKRGAHVPKDSCCTVTSGTCKYCKKRNRVLSPIRDYDWPKYRVKAIFD